MFVFSALRAEPRGRGRRWSWWRAEYRSLRAKRGFARFGRL